MALTKITTNVIEAGAISTASLADTSITADKLAATLDLTGKAITVATASAGDNDTTVASTAFVSTAIANLADSAPSTLDTLNELAAALGDDANFSTTVTNSIATKAPLTTPQFTNRVGIGVAAHASAALNITSTDQHMRLNNGSELGIISLESDGALRIWSHGDSSNNEIEFYQGSGSGSASMTIGGTGNVGIGTTSPNQLLHLDNSASSSDSAGIRIISGTAGTAKILLGDTGYGSRGRVLYDNSDDSLQLWGANSTTSAERMRIDSSGNVLVGKTAVGVGNAGIELRANNMAAISRASDNVLYLNRITNDGSILEFRQDNVAVGNIGVVSADRMYFATADGLGLQFDKDNNRIIPCDTAGAYNNNVELGDSTLEFTNLWLSGAANIVNLKISGSQGTDGQLLTSTGSGIAWEDAPAGGPTFKTFGTGSIMIGDDATGTINAADNNTGLGVDVFAALTTGDSNVAIGKSALTSNTTGYENVAVGIETLFLGTAGIGNTAVGRIALRANTSNNNTAVGNAALTSNTSGGSNVAMGAYALQTNTTSSNNTAVGRGALLANTASSNTAVGYNALTTTTTATQVTALGFRAGEDSTGSSSTFIGYLAGAETSTGGQNTFIGASTAESGVCTGTQNTLVGGNNATGITSGANNTVLGTHAARNLTTGAGHVAIGTHARRLATAGNNGVYVGIYSGYNHTAGRSVMVGEYAGYDTTTTDDSVFVGRLAGQNVTTGYTNVIMGDRAGNLITTGYANTCIGYKAGDNITTGYAHTLIGNAVRSAYASNSSGEIGLGVNLSTNGTGYFTVGSGTSKGYYLYGSTNGFTAGSDERLKEEITDSTVGLSFINDLRPRTFKWKKRKDIPSDMPQYEEASEERHLKLEKVQLGMIAQEVKTVIDNHSELPAGFSGWTTDVEGTQCLDYVGFIQPLIKAVQELSTKLDAAEARIASLEGE